MFLKAFFTNSTTMKELDEMLKDHQEYLNKIKIVKENFKTIEEYENGTISQYKKLFLLTTTASDIRGIEFLINSIKKEQNTMVKRHLIKKLLEDIESIQDRKKDILNLDHDWLEFYYFRWIVIRHVDNIYQKLKNNYEKLLKY